MLNVLQVGLAGLVVKLVGLTENSCHLPHTHDTRMPSLPPALEQRWPTWEIHDQFKNNSTAQGIGWSSSCQMVAYCLDTCDSFACSVWLALWQLHSASTLAKAAAKLPRHEQSYMFYMWKSSILIANNSLGWVSCRPLPICPHVSYMLCMKQQHVTGKPQSEWGDLGTPLHILNS